MDLIDRLSELSKRYEQQLDILETEEATKNALVMPFISALGYDVFNPSEVVPEFTADVGIKRGEKVDYAIVRESKPIILIESKRAGADLDLAHISQLFRYFTVTPARIGVLTNGLEYRFFSDLEAPNKMDDAPFLEIDIRSLTSKHIDQLMKLMKHSFDIDTILTTASELKFTRGIKKSLSEEWQNPSADFIRILASRVFNGRFTQNVMDQFLPITKRAFHEFVNDRVNERLKSALAQANEEASPDKTPETDRIEISEIETSADELEGFHIVRAIVSNVVDPNRVYIRDTKSYCGILLDDNNRKPICRLHFNSDSRRFITIFDENREAVRQDISRLTDLFRHAEAMRQVCASYDTSVPA